MNLFVIFPVLLIIGTLAGIAAPAYVEQGISAFWLLACCISLLLSGLTYRFYFLVLVAGQLKLLHIVLWHVLMLFVLVASYYLIAFLLLA